MPLLELNANQDRDLGVPIAAVQCVAGSVFVSGSEIETLRLSKGDSFDAENASGLHLHSKSGVSLAVAYADGFRAPSDFTRADLLGEESD